MRRRIGYLVALAFAPAVLAVGCAKSDTLDIGDGHEKVAATGASLEDYAGKWDGYVEAYNFYGGSDRIRVDIDSRGTGTIEFGDSRALPPPDPDIGYPPLVPDPNGMPGMISKPFAEYRPPAYPGFAYPISAKMEAKRIRVETSTQEVYVEWCSMQEPMLSVGAVPTQYTCAVGINGMSDPAQCTQNNVPGGTPEPIDCGKAYNCLTQCTCTEDECFVSEVDDIHFDAALGGDANDELTGTLMLAGDRIIVHMTRM